MIVRLLACPYVYVYDIQKDLFVVKLDALSILPLILIMEDQKKNVLKLKLIHKPSAAYSTRFRESYNENTTVWYVKII